MKQYFDNKPVLALLCSMENIVLGTFKRVKIATVKDTVYFYKIKASHYIVVK